MQPEVQDLAQNQELSTQYQEWRRSRGVFNIDLKLRREEAVKQGWQREYFSAGRSGEH